MNWTNKFLALLMGIICLECPIFADCKNNLHDPLIHKWEPRFTRTVDLNYDNERIDWVVRDLNDKYGLAIQLDYTYTEPGRVEWMGDKIVNICKDRKQAYKKPVTIHENAVPYWQALAKLALKTDSTLYIDQRYGTHVPTICYKQISVGDSFGIVGPYLLLPKQDKHGRVVIELLAFPNDIGSLSEFQLHQITLSEDGDKRTVPGKSVPYYFEAESGEGTYFGQMLLIQWISNRPINLSRNTVISGDIKSEVIDRRYYMDYLYRNTHIESHGLKVDVVRALDAPTPERNYPIEVTPAWDSDSEKRWSVVMSVADFNEYGLSDAELEFIARTKYALMLDLSVPHKTLEKYQALRDKLPRLRFNGDTGLSSEWDSVTDPCDCEKCATNSHATILESVECKAKQGRGFPSLNSIEGYETAQLRIKDKYKGKDYFPIGLVLHKYMKKTSHFQIEYQDSDKDKSCRPAKKENLVPVPIF